MQGTPPPRQEIGSVWDDAVPQQPAQAPNAGMPGAQIYNIPMNAGQMYVFPKTTASTALGLSIAGLALGFFCFPLCGLLAVPGFFMSQSSLNITNSMPGAPRRQHRKICANHQFDYNGAHASGSSAVCFTHRP